MGLLCRQWNDAIRAALQLQERNTDAPPPPASSSPSSPSRGLGGRSASSKSVRELQEQLKQDRLSQSQSQGEGGGVVGSERSLRYSRADFLAEQDAQRDTQQHLQSLSTQAESGSEVLYYCHRHHDHYLCCC